MNINATLFVQIFSFLLFVAFTRCYVWPPIVAAMESRKDKIAQGLTDAEQARYVLANAKKESDKILKEARVEANELLQKASERARVIVESAKMDAKTQANQLLEKADQAIEISYASAREALLQDIAGLVHDSAKQVIGKHIDTIASNDLIEKAILEVREAS